jgi:transposase-like protein
MAAANRVFTPQFRLSTIKRVLKGEKVTALCHELKIGRSALYRWCDSYRREGIAGIERGTGRPVHGMNPVTAPKRTVDSEEVARYKIAVAVDLSLQHSLSELAWIA